MSVWFWLCLYVAVVSWAFVITYGLRKKWYKSGMGINMMTLSATIGFIFTWLLFDGIPAWVRISATIILALCMTHRLALLLAKR